VFSHELTGCWGVQTELCLLCVTCVDDDVVSKELMYVSMKLMYGVCVNVMKLMYVSML
jgi:hypothetical protein